MGRDYRGVMHTVAHNVEAEVAESQAVETESSQQSEAVNTRFNAQFHFSLEDE